MLLVTKDRTDVDAPEPSIDLVELLELASRSATTSTGLGWRQQYEHLLLSSRVVGSSTMEADYEDDYEKE